jgi:hypothetical protein
MVVVQATAEQRDDFGRDGSGGSTCGFFEADYNRGWGGSSSLAGDGLASEGCGGGARCHHPGRAGQRHGLQQGQIW